MDHCKGNVVFVTSRLYMIKYVGSLWNCSVIASFDEVCACRLVSSLSFDPLIDILIHR